jgi:hypothetical protein
MTEAEWHECYSPETMLAHLGERASERKKCLFACACIRRVWPSLTDEWLRQAVEWCERGADRPRDAGRLRQVRRAVRRLCRELDAEEARRSSWPARAASAAARAVLALLARGGPILERPRDHRELPDVVTCTRIARTAARAAEAQREDRSGVSAPTLTDAPRPLAALDAVELIREIFGNPFRPVTIDPAWLVRNDGIVVRLARAIYDERRFLDLPMLADALEAAGCADAAILDHCRAPMEHTRGCWVVDALLGLM